MKILWIDPLPSLIKEFYKLSERYNDSVITISNYEIPESNNIKINIFDRYIEIPDILQKLDFIPDIVFTFNEVYCFQVEYLSDFYNINTVQNNLGKFREKSNTKLLFEKYDIPHAKGKIYSNTHEINISILKYPLIVKPSAGYASAGVAKVDNLEDMRKELTKIELLNSVSFIKDSFSNQQIILEEYIGGEEYACDSIWKNGERIVTIIQKNYNGDGPYFPDTLYMIDPNLNKEIEAKLLNIEDYAHKQLGTKIGFTHTEYKIFNGDAYIIETSNRPGGGGLFFEHIFKSTGINYLDIFFKNLIHDEEIQPLSYTYDKKNYYYINIVQFKEVGKIKKIHGMSSLEKDNNIINIYDYTNQNDMLLPLNLRTGYNLIFTGLIDINLNPVKEIELINSQLSIELLN